MISQDEIEAIKHGVELVSFMKARGVELKQVGENYRGSAPSMKTPPHHLPSIPRKTCGTALAVGRAAM
jgi:hypothetical protein